MDPFSLNFWQNLTFVKHILRDELVRTISSTWINLRVSCSFRTYKSLHISSAKSSSFRWFFHFWKLWFFLWSKIRLESSLKMCSICSMRIISRKHAKKTQSLNVTLEWVQFVVWFDAKYLILGRFAIFTHKHIYPRIHGNWIVRVWKLFDYKNLLLRSSVFF